MVLTSSMSVSIMRGLAAAPPMSSLWSSLKSPLYSLFIFCNVPMRRLLGSTRCPRLVLAMIEARRGRGGEASAAPMPRAVGTVAIVAIVAGFAAARFARPFRPATVAAFLVRRKEAAASHCGCRVEVDGHGDAVDEIQRDLRSADVTTLLYSMVRSASTCRYRRSSSQAQLCCQDANEWPRSRQEL